MSRWSCSENSIIFVIRGSKFDGQTTGDIRNSNRSVQNRTIPLVTCTLWLVNLSHDHFPFYFFTCDDFVTIYLDRHRMMFLWCNRSQWKQHMALSLQHLSDSEILQTCSTSPYAEGPDFVENERRYNISNTINLLVISSSTIAWISRRSSNQSYTACS